MRNHYHNAIRQYCELQAILLTALQLAQLKKEYGVDDE